MSKYYEMFSKDIRFLEGMNSCMSCGVCTATCPASQFYEYDPRQIVMIVHNQNDDEIEELLKSDTIWYCGQCMSCRPRCPRANTPAYVIQTLRTVSQKLGFFTHSERGRQQIVIKRTIGHNILQQGYCITPKDVNPDLHPEQGGVWDWIHKNNKDFYSQFAPNYEKKYVSGSTLLRKMSDETLSEIDRIFELSGAKDFYQMLENYSDKVAREMGYDGVDENYFMDVYKGRK